MRQWNMLWADLFQVVAPVAPGAPCYLSYDCSQALQRAPKFSGEGYIAMWAFMLQDSQHSGAGVWGHLQAMDSE